MGAEDISQTGDRLSISWVNRLLMAVALKPVGGQKVCNESVLQAPVTCQKGQVGYCDGPPFSSKELGYLGSSGIELICQTTQRLHLRFSVTTPRAQAKLHPNRRTIAMTFPFTTIGSSWMLLIGLKTIAMVH